MRLLTGCSPDGKRWYTTSPSEPILALASHYHLYPEARNNKWDLSLRTLSMDLCSAGLVEKGLLGELCARTLILIARDFADGKKTKTTQDFLQPVSLLKFLHTLFGPEWAGNDQVKFDEAFRNAWVNFTHWILTKDSMPADSS